MNMCRPVRTAQSHVDNILYKQDVSGMDGTGELTRVIVQNTCVSERAHLLDVELILVPRGRGGGVMD